MLPLLNQKLNSYICLGESLTYYKDYKKNYFPDIAFNVIKLTLSKILVNND